MTNEQTHEISSTLVVLFREAYLWLQSLISPFIALAEASPLLRRRQTSGLSWKRWLNGAVLIS